MAITVRDLLEMPHLRLRLHSGAGGVDRAVSWTHTSDLPEPWRWLTGGELLMTNGMSFPSSGADQAALVAQLVDAGASALAIGERMYCPPLTPELAAASEELGLSVLIIAYPMPFVAISQAVAAANLLEQSDRLIRTERIYRTLQRMVSLEVDSSLLSRDLSQQLGCAVHVCHRESSEPWYPHDPRFDDVLTDALRGGAGGARQLRAGAFAVPLADGRELRLVDVPTQPAAVLALVSEPHHVLDAILVQHAVTVIALELAQSLMRVEQDRRLGSELLAQLIEGQVDPRAGRRQLQSLGLDISETTLFAISSDDLERLRDLHVALWRNDIRHLVVHRSGLLYVLCVERPEVLAVLRAHLGDAATVGISGPVATLDRVPEAVREAAWAMRAAADVPTRTFRYGDATPILGIAALDDAGALATRVLGPLVEHDQVHNAGLLHTLEVFFAHQRSWQKTADALHVHRQTVLYRIRKVEQITGFDVNDTADIAQLWLALQAHTLLSGPPREPRG
ncbi:PucR family transcriptional regulator [Nocardioides ginsengisoli]|uniref:PucR family transcriptional regulator n=1 Tax=Nocardioides ginsengisoli TaxID=363868 RepID=A0ABW3W5F2_9ACTN